MIQALPPLLPLHAIYIAISIHLSLFGLVRIPLSSEILALKHTQSLGRQSRMEEVRNLIMACLFLPAVPRAIGFFVRGHPVRSPPMGQSTLPARLSSALCTAEPRSIPKPTVTSSSIAFLAALSFALGQLKIPRLVGHSDSGSPWALW